MVFGLKSVISQQLAFLLIYRIQLVLIPSCNLWWLKSKSSHAIPITIVALNGIGMFYFFEIRRWATTSIVRQLIVDLQRLIHVFHRGEAFLFENGCSVCELTVHEQGGRHHVAFGTRLSFKVRFIC